MDVSTICGPLHAGSMVETTGTHSYSTYNSIVAVVPAVEMLLVYSVLEVTHTAVARTSLMRVARTTSSVRSRYPPTRLVLLLICSVSSWFSFGIPIRSSEQYTTGLRLMTIETRCSKVIFPNYSKKKPAEDTLVPPLWGTREKNVCFSRIICCLLYTSPSPRDKRQSRMPSSA